MMKAHQKAKLRSAVWWFALTMATVWAMALNMGGCAMVPADKVIEAASKCIADATNILASQAEMLETRKAAAELLQVEKMAAAQKCDAKPALDPSPYTGGQP
jgi:hypothetical protein